MSSNTARLKVRKNLTWAEGQGRKEKETEKVGDVINQMPPKHHTSAVQLGLRSAKATVHKTDKTKDRKRKREASKGGNVMWPQHWTQQQQQQQ